MLQKKKIRPPCVLCHKEGVENDSAFLLYCGHLICFHCIPLASSQEIENADLETTWLTCPQCKMKYCTLAKFFEMDESDILGKVEQEQVVQHCCQKWSQQLFWILCKHCSDYFCSDCFKLHLNFIYIESILNVSCVSLISSFTFANISLQSPTFFRF